MFSSTTQVSHSIVLSDKHIWGFDSFGNALKIDDCNVALWLAHATLPSLTTVDPIYTQKNNQKLWQQQAVRSLLSQLIDVIKQQDRYHNLPLHNPLLQLNDTAYPFRLMPSNYQVCFTHSHHKVACAIAQQGRIGIDLEEINIPLHIAQRFFHFKEVAWLNTLTTLHQVPATKLLWSLKESLIKLNGLDSLITGLGINMLSIAKVLFYQSVEQTDHASRSHSPFFYSTHCFESKHLYIYIPVNKLILINACP